MLLTGPFGFSLHSDRSLGLNFTHIVPNTRPYLGFFAHFIG